MAQNEKSSFPLRISSSTFSQIQTMMQMNASLLLPVGSLEPIGETLALGAINYCCESVAETISQKLQILMAPMLMYANNTPFKSFEGCSGISIHTQTNAIRECCNSWLFHGFKRIIIITFAMDGQLGTAAAVLQINKKQENEKTVTLFSLQNEPFFRSFCASEYPGKEFGRSEWGIHALVSFLCPALRIGMQSDSSKFMLPDERTFKRWHKCGRDPEKLRKMSPVARLSDNFQIPDANVGKNLFNVIVTNLTEKITSLMIDNYNAS
jgi:hypothetical protein